MKNLSVLSLAILGLLIMASCQQNQEKEKPYVVVLSLDGFRWDYTAHADTPVLDSLADAGVKAVSMIPSYPTKTFPNHYTLATGLYPDHHGVVGNRFHAPDLNRFYRISDRNAVTDGTFYGGEPIWVTAENQNIRTATLFWVGASAEIKGTRPSRWYIYDESLPFEQRIDSVYEWLMKPEKERPQLIMWYLHEPDHTGHEYGPLHDSTLHLVERLDKWLGHYFHQMRKLPIFDQVNFIVTSDHGMAETSEERMVLIDQYIDTADLVYMDGSNPNMNLKVKPGRMDKVFRALKGTPHIHAWKSDSLPERLHYGTHVRTHDISIVAYPGWALATTWKPRTSKGTHGYDNAFKDMHTIFYAAGPAFRKGYTQPEMENVNLYPLIAAVLDLRPAKTDGDLSEVESMLSGSKK
ncbi:MAG: ectonucleotide pyrophosphatase/phosphodiesterase [bacterium]